MFELSNPTFLQLTFENQSSYGALQVLQYEIQKNTNKYSNSHRKFLA